MISIPVKCFSLHHSITSGQPPLFLMDYENRKASFLFKKRALVELKQAGDELITDWKGDASEDEIRDEVIMRFRLEDDMKKIYKNIIKDRFMLNAVTVLYGLRLTLTDPWETLVCFICSMNNNLRNIKCIVNNLSLKFGERVELEGEYFNSFPDAQSLSKADFRALRECKLGFRAKFIKSVAEACMDGHLLKKILEMRYDEAKEELIKIDGVGEKIANAVLLFGYGQLLAFPIDVWVRRTMSEVYLQNKKVSDKKIKEFANDYWNGYAGYAQQYVYWYGKMQNRLHELG